MRDRLLLSGLKEVVPLIGLEPTTPSLRIMFDSDFRELEGMCQRWTGLPNPLVPKPFS